MGVQAGQRDGRLAGMFGFASDRGHQPWPACDRFPLSHGTRQTGEQAPPVVDQRHRPGRELAAMQTVGGKSAPAPLVFQLIEGIFGIGAVAVELSEGEDFGVEVGDQHRVLVPRKALARLAVGLDEAEPLLAIALQGDEHLVLQGPTQDNDPPSHLPAGQSQFAVLTFPPLVGIHPAGFPEEVLDVAFDVLRELELEELRLLPLLQRHHEDIGAEATIAAEDLRLPVQGQLGKDRQQPRQRLAA